VSLLILDCDGVLIDSEPIACRIDAEELTRIGYPCTAEDIARDYVGLSGKEMFARIEAALGRPLPEGLHRACYDRLMAAFDAELEAIPGIAAAVDRIESAGWATCVASSSSPARLDHTLGLVGLRDRFGDRVFNSTMVARGKPAPDLFLHAAAVMGTAPARCIVVEDSTAGVQAARAAGMTVLGFTGGSHCGPGHAERLLALGARACFADMAELPLRIGAPPG